MSDVLNTIDEKEIPNKKLKLIDEFYKRFEEEMLRKPTLDEMMDMYDREQRNKPERRI